MDRSVREVRGTGPCGAGVVLLEPRGASQRPRMAVGGRPLGRPGVRAPERHPLGQVDRDRPGSAGRSSGLDHDLAIGHYKPVNSSRYLNSAHEYVFHFTHHGDVPLDRLAIGVPYQDRSNVTRWGAGRSGLRYRGTPGSCPTAPFAVGPPIGRIPPHSRRSSRNSACGSTDGTGSSSRSTPSSGSGVPPSPRSGSR